MLLNGTADAAKNVTVEKSTGCVVAWASRGKDAGKGRGGHKRNSSRERDGGSQQPAAWQIMQIECRAQSACTKCSGRLGRRAQKGGGRKGSLAENKTRAVRKGSVQRVRRSEEVADCRACAARGKKERKSKVPGAAASAANRRWPCAQGV